ncbi:hypothetical protein MUK42_36044 [Musa troglodytarum]|uniref:Uncharacterized protein n=1 Tax=Musa troglodytarum TaxID=320322 RepID=A0A9E7EC68_9LILI|nr:hypothetical protein MUK42_36044 [Musa troglodytarum]
MSGWPKSKSHPLSMSLISSSSVRVSNLPPFIFLPSSVDASLFLPFYCALKRRWAREEAEEEVAGNRRIRHGYYRLD